MHDTLDPHEENGSFDHFGQETVPPGSMPTAPGRGGAGPVPLSEPIPTAFDEMTPGPDGAMPGPTPLPVPVPTPIPIPLPHVCQIDLKAGCYAISFEPNTGTSNFFGSLRVEVKGTTTTISGDLYEFKKMPSFPFPSPLPPSFPRPVILGSSPMPSSSSSTTT